MVEEVQAWRDATGVLHSTKYEAAQADAVEELKKLDMFNHASAMAIVKNAAKIVPLLQQVLDARPKVTVVEKNEGMN